MIIDLQHTLHSGQEEEYREYRPVGGNVVQTFLMVDMSQ